ncbi:MAG: hypothetical protein KDB14_28375 [Planctomycetales bacterium]|nr:hypothetical protein [Planctomycetales bacterium]
MHLHQGVADPTPSEKWLDAIKKGASELPAQDVDELFEALVSPPLGTDWAGRRALAITSLHCLPARPSLRKSMALRVIRNSISYLSDGDRSAKTCTGLEDAIAEVACTPRLNRWICEELLTSFIDSSGDTRVQLGLAVMTAKRPLRLTPQNAKRQVELRIDRLASPGVKTRVLSGLELVELLYASQGERDLLKELRLERPLFDALMKATSADAATRHAAIWAMRWLAGPSSRNRGPQLRKRDTNALRRLAMRRENEETIGNIAQLLSKGASISPNVDLVLEVAGIADGMKTLHSARFTPQKTREDEADESVELLKNCLDWRCTPDQAVRLALGLGRLGWRNDRMTPSLVEAIKDHRRYSGDRIEAFLYLLQIGSNEVIDAFEESAVPGVEVDLDLKWMCILGLVAIGDVATLKRLLVVADEKLEQLELSAFAFALSHRGDEGKMALRELKEHGNEDVRRCAAIALGDRDGLVPNWRDRVIRFLSRRIFLVRGKDTTARQAWYYVFVVRDVEEFESMSGAVSLNLNDFGVILHSGYGDFVPDVFRDEMFTRFGFQLANDEDSDSSE